MLFFAVSAALSGVLGDPIISGTSPWQYQYMPERVQVPGFDANDVGNGHGLCRDKEGNIYFTFQPKSVDNDTQALVRFASDGTKGAMLGLKGPGGLSRGTPHGLRIEHDEAQGKSFLYHANNNQLVFKTTLDGDIIWTADLSDWETKYPQYWPVKPTDAIVVPGTDVLLLADGYGSSFVHQFNKNTGEFIPGKSFGGKGNATGDPVQFHTPHGINLDPRRSGTFVVSDRSNNRLVWVTADGKYVDSKSTISPIGMALPCNVDIRFSEKDGYTSVIPSLGSGTGNLSGADVGIYTSASSTTPASVIELANLLGDQGHQHPHDAIFLENGDVIVCCWSGPANPGQGPAKGTISYWQRLPPSEDATAPRSGDYECQDLDSCPRFYNNTMVDYSAQTPDSDLVVDDALRKFMENQTALYLDQIESNRPPSHFDSANVFEGLAGRAFLYLRLYNRTGDASKLSMAVKYAESALLFVETIPKKYTGFLWGRTGVYAVAAVVFDASGDSSRAQKMIGNVVSICKDAPDDAKAEYDDWDSGRAGLLYAGAFLNSYFGAGTVSDALLETIAQAIVRRGLQVSSTSEYLEFVSPIEGGKWLGQSHGSAGVIHALMLATPQLVTSNSTVQKLVVGTLDRIVAQQQGSGNFPTEYFNATDDILVQWDHGAPGVMNTLVEAYKLLGSGFDRYRAAAEKAADTAWERGLVVKGLMLCHGISGNTYMQLRLAQLLGEKKYVYRALQFQRFVMSYPPLYDLDLMRRPTPNPYNMYTGSWESAVMLWSDLLATANDPAQARMPAYVPGL